MSPFSSSKVYLLYFILYVSTYLNYFNFSGLMLPSPFDSTLSLFSWAFSYRLDRTAFLYSLGFA